MIRQNFFYESKKNKLIIKKKVEKILKKTFEEINVNNKTLSSLGKNFKLNYKIDLIKKFEKFYNVIIVGMGGSVLGSKAIYSFLAKNIKKNFIFIDNLDQSQIEYIKSKFTSHNSLLLIISKSGNTLETLTVTNLLDKIIKSSNAIIISEKKNNLLYEYSKRKKIYFIEHRDFIGGRYSVLTEVGMVPAYFMGLKVNSFRKTLRKFYSLKKKLLINNISNMVEIYKSKKFNSLVFLNYDKELNNFIFWCQQLIAESLGKKKMGLMPVLSTAPRDHHSLLQLYLDGPRDKFFYIFNLKNKTKLKTKSGIFGNKFNFAENKNLLRIRMSQKNALLKTLRENKIHYREFEISKFNESTIGELFAYFMIETVLLGYYFDINPFDQPAVESTKKFTEKLLANSSKDNF